MSGNATDPRGWDFDRSALDGKLALVTGGAGGIGFAIARGFAMLGMRVLLGDRDLSAARRAADGLVSDGLAATAVALDVTQRSDWESVADHIDIRNWGIHLLCNNAGVIATGWRVEEIPEQVWRTQMAVNLDGVFFGVQAMLPLMESHGQGGHVVNTASMAGLGARAHHGAYVSSKHAVVGLSDALRLELSGRRIGVSVLCPSSVATNIVESSRQTIAAGGTTGEPTQRRAEMPPDAMAPAVVGSMVVESVVRNDFLIITHPSTRARLAEREGEIQAAFVRSELHHSVR